MKIILRKLLEIITFLSFIINGCDENVIGPDLANTYFPLSEGNIWYYRDYFTPNDSIVFTHPSQEFDITYQVINITKINGSNYFVMEERYYQTLHTAIDTTYYRAESQKLYMYKKDYTSQQYIGGLFADFSIQPGDTFQCQIYSNEYVAEVVQKTLTTTKFHYYIPGAADEELEITFQKSLGIINNVAIDWGHGILLSTATLN
jgi:hypothetical protein